MRTIKFSTLHRAQVVNEFEDSPSSITSASLALLSRQIVQLSMVEEMFVFFLYECVHRPVQLLSLLFFLLRVQLLQ